MNTPTSLFLIAAVSSSLLGIAACSSDDTGGSTGSGGGTSGTASTSATTGTASTTATTGTGPTGATCESTCAKSIALACPSGEHDQAACVASCDGQQASCSAMAAEFQAYLDCIQNTSMVCGEFTDAPSSPDCVAQGLAIFQCASMGAGGGGGAGGN